MVHIMHHVSHGVTFVAYSPRRQASAVRNRSDYDKLLNDLVNAHKSSAANECQHSHIAWPKAWLSVGDFAIALESLQACRV